MKGGCFMSNLKWAFYKVRLSYYFLFLFVFFVGLLMIIPKVKLTGTQQTLFSVNSFLLGFYFTPVIKSQKDRIEELGKNIRAQSVALFKSLVKTRDIQDKKTHDDVQVWVGKYIEATLASKKVGAGETEYDAMIGKLVHFNAKNKDAAAVNKVLDSLVDNQTNRTNFDMLMGRKIYKNEWYILMTLFIITLTLPVIVDLGGSPLFHIVASLLCASLCLLIVTLLKINALAHKQAKEIWKPLESLLESDFRRVSHEE